jgi:hypothetical protein
MCYQIFALNRKLKENDLKQFKWETLDLFMRIGLKMFITSLKIYHLPTNASNEVLVIETIEPSWDDVPDSGLLTGSGKSENLNDASQSEKSKSKSANVDVLNEIDQSKNLQEKENDGNKLEHSEDSDSNSDISDTFDLRHTGICDNCQYMGLVGTLCPHCQELQHVLKQPGQNTLRELTDHHRAKKFTTEERLSMMQAKGAGFCAECLSIGPVGTICTFCIYKDINLGPNRYAFQAEILNCAEGVCFNCHKTNLEGEICTRCAGGVTARLPDKGNSKILSFDQLEEVNATMTRTKTESASWLLDSGATVHVTNDPSLLIKAKPSKEYVRVGNGEEVKAELVGDVEMELDNGQGLLLESVLYVPNFVRNIVSLMKVTNAGITVELGTETVKFKMNNKTLTMKKAKGDEMWCIKPKTKIINIVCDVETKKGETIKTMDLNEAHEKLGHPDENTVKATLQYWGYKATGTFDPCDGCLKEKAKAKDVSHKPTSNVVTEPGKRLFLDATGPFEISAGGTKYDTHLVDQAARSGWVTHIARQNEVSAMVDNHLTYLRSNGYAIQYL